jgi:hypothetical protein
MALKATVPAAALVGLCWGIGIMSLDRWLVASMTRRQGMYLVLPRVFLALLFSVVISTPLTLQIFNSEIAQQMSLDHATAAANFGSSQAVTKLQAKITADQAAVTGYQGVINSNGQSAAMTPANDPTMVQLDSKLTSDQKQVTYYQNAAHCEQYGGSNCSSVVGGNVVQGTGSAYTYDEQQLTSYTSAVKTDNQNITAEQQTLAGQNSAKESNAVGSARTNLNHAQAQLTADTSSLNQLKGNFNVTNANNTGILARLKALDELRMSDLNMLVAEVVLFLFFAAIELLPVIVKLLLNRGEETPYEQAIASSDVVNAMEADHARKSRYLETVRKHNRAAAQARAVQATWDEQVVPELTALTIQAQREVELSKLARWRDRELAASADLSRHWKPAGLKQAEPRRALLGRLWWGRTRHRAAAMPVAAPAPAPSAQVESSAPIRRALDSGPLPRLRDGFGYANTASYLQQPPQRPQL